MNQKEIKELIEFLVEKDISEFELERGDVKVRVKRLIDARNSAASGQVAALPSQTIAGSTRATVTHEPASESVIETAEESGLHIVRSPIVGSYYESPSPGAPAFVKVGDQVQIGQVLCIVEAMKLMNEIESDVAGEIVKMLASNSQPVEYGQPLFAIRVK